jgi:hypothetical protein
MELRIVGQIACVADVDSGVVLTERAHLNRRPAFD